MILINLSLDIDGLVLLKFEFVYESLRLEPHIYFHDCFVIYYKIQTWFFRTHALLPWLNHSLTFIWLIGVQEIFFAHSKDIKSLKEKFVISIDIVIIHVDCKHQRAFDCLCANSYNLLLFQTHSWQFQMVDNNSFLHELA
jgi:hypothetical protein